MLIIINIIGHKFSGVNTAYTCVFVCIYKIQMFSVKRRSTVVVSVESYAVFNVE